MTLPDSDPVRIYTDGACKGNPGVGGWGAVLYWRGRERRICDGEENTTNNRMELMAAIRALESLKKTCRVVLTTDSTYLKNGMTQWMAAWLARGFKNKSGGKIKNEDLWRRLDMQARRHTVEWRWVRGHERDEGNLLADQLANEGAVQGRIGGAGR